MATTRLTDERPEKADTRRFTTLHRGPPARSSIRPIIRPTVGAAENDSVFSCQSLDVTNTAIDAFLAASTHSLSCALRTSSGDGTSKRR